MMFAILPLRVLYIISDGFYYLNYYLVQYRKKIVFQNLRNSFPEKSNDEIKNIAKKFYRHFGDLFVETVKLLNMPYEEGRRRIKLKNPEILERLYGEHKLILAAMGHYNNWEWLSLITRPEFHIVSLYKPLHDPNFDRFMIKLRTMKGCMVVPSTQTLRFLNSWNNPEKRAFLCFIADQSPQKKDIHYWTQFLNQSTPIFVGIEKIAVKTNLPVCFFRMEKIKRGYYELEVVPISENPASSKPFEITEAHVRLLENDIRNKPEFWLWSHRRWKRQQINNEIINTQPDA
jgi:KDO2-lipid IV(A) lauroyltransferase